VGLHIDGQQVQIAHLHREGSQIRIVTLDSAALITRLDLEQGEEGEESVPEQVDAGDILGLVEEPTVADDAPTEEEGEEQAPETNTEVLYRLLGGISFKKRSLAISLMEGRVFFSEFADNFGLKGKRLKKRLLEETEKKRTSEGAISLEEQHGFLTTDRGTVLSIVHEDPLEILHLLDELKSFIGRMQIRLIDPLEITLMNLVKLAYPAEEHVTAIAHVGQDFSRVIFMQNGDYLAFSQPINEGVNSPQVLHTVYSRILFEQDVSDIPEIGRVLLTGECQALEAEPFFAEQFPDAQVDYLALQELDLSSLEEEDRNLISPYAIPIGLAWKALLPKAASLYPSNFLPEARRRQQNPFELAWHGLVLLVLLMVSFPIFGWKAQNQSRIIEGLELTIKLVEEQIDEHNPYVKMVDDLHVQIEDYQRNFALIDTLAAHKVTWSPKLQKWADVSKAIGGLWMERFSTSEGGTDIQADWGGEALQAPQEIFMNGKATDRGRVSDIAALLGSGQIRSLIRSQIRGKTVYEFDLTVPVAATDTSDTEP